MTSNPLPTRLINVENDNRPFVEVTSAQTKGPYAALSYVWGNGKRVMTTKSNYDAHRKCLSIEGLPLTIADAVHATRALGYKYLWVDGLCIIQDNKDDLDRELPKMGDIYRYAQLTICAQSAESSHAGLFVNRDSRLYRPCKIPITITSDDGPRKRDVTLATTWTGPDYLNNRGWVLQERVLSSRCLMFGQQMAWSCTMGHAQETRPVLQLKPALPQSSTRWIPERLRQALYSTPAATGASRSSSRHASHFNIWYTMLEEYGDRELTFVADNIPALSGIAAMFRQAYGTTYLAGLWKEDLSFGLAWYVALNDRRPVCDDIRGPSWSWASVGKVRIKFRSWRRTSDTLPDAGADVLDVDYDTSGMKNPYGFVSKGTISLCALLQKAVLEYAPDFATTRGKTSYGKASPGFGGVDAKEQPRYPALLLHHGTYQPMAEAALDRPFDSVSGAGALMSGPAANSVARVDVWCVLLHVQRDRDKYHGTLLILKRSKANPSLFSRLGLGFLGNEYTDWFGTHNENEERAGSAVTKGLAKRTVHIV
ncbi:hypothetical protein AK830_g423 [Neonectria ditissima]|uniref:Heterokaryon incompatibility domain-containing protein n=1 Tax=Neonectria ditissima TaxID=78410 RepID=A0A0P7BQ12_9HYPO|nr:hypothetical protein AK830_g423 [Neonectria ditissima]